MATDVNSLIAETLGLAQAATGQDVMPLTLETNILPAIPLTGAGEGSGLGGLALSIVRPTLRGVPGLGTVAPYGEAFGVGTIVGVGMIAVWLIGAFVVVRSIVR